MSQSNVAFQMGTKALPYIAATVSKNRMMDLRKLISLISYNFHDYSIIEIGIEIITCNSRLLALAPVTSYGYTHNLILYKI
jgi:hypothetical protein